MTTTNNKYPVCIGDKIRLWTVSPYDKNKPDTIDEYHYVGYYQKHSTRHGILSCLYPINDSSGDNHLFIQETFTIKSPTNKDQNESISSIKYNQPLILVNQDGLVWSCKTGGVTSYIGPRGSLLRGSLTICFTNNNTASSSSIIHYGDTGLSIKICSSNRHSTKYDLQILGVFKKRTSKTVGGYIVVDTSSSKIKPLIVSIHPAHPSIDSVTKESSSSNGDDNNDLELTFKDVYTVSLKSADNDNDNGIVILSKIKLSNNGMVVITKSIVLENEDSSVYVPCSNSPGGGLCLSISERRVVEEQMMVVPNHREKLLTQCTLRNLAILVAMMAVLVATGGISVTLYATGFTLLTFILGLSIQTYIEVNAPELLASESVTTSRLEFSITIDSWSFVKKDIDSQSASGGGNVIPERFIRACKGDKALAKRRYNATVTWRKNNRMDEILREPHVHFDIIKANYPHYFHLRGRNNEPVYFETPGKINLKTLRNNGVTLDVLLRHYAMVTEFLWSKIEISEEGKSIYVIDVVGIGFRDFVGDVVDFVKKASAFTSAHYPERAGYIFVINAPSWFSVVWNVVKPMIDEVTKQKVYILKAGNTAATNAALLERIPIENLPPAYGGTSVPLGSAPEEKALKELMDRNNSPEAHDDDGGGDESSLSVLGSVKSDENNEI